MRNVAIEYPAPRQIRFVELGAAPAPGPNEVIIRTRYSGVTNGTERHALLGEHGWKGVFPSKHGYQCVGQIEKAGANVTQFQEGDWVFNGQYVGHRGWHQIDVSDPNGRHLVYKLPEGLDPKLCGLMGVAGVALRGVRRFRIGPAQKVWVAGQGPIGHFAAQAARAFGAYVTVTDVDERRLEVAKECGAHRAFNARDEKTWDNLKELAPYDCMIDACGSDSFLYDILDHGLVGHGSVMGLLAVHSEVRFNWSLLHGTEASIEVSCHFSLDDLRVLAHFIRQGLIKMEPTITHFVGIDEAIGIYETLRDTPSEMLGAVFDWGD